MAQCQFCGSEDKKIHPDSGQQYGEPVCTDCYAESFTGPDPTNDEQYANSPDDLYSGLYGQGKPRAKEFHTSHMKHRGYLSEQEDEEGYGGSEPDYEGIHEARMEKRAERWNYQDTW